MEEARDVFGNDRAVGCLVSIGTGYPGTIGLARSDSFQKFLPTKLIDVVKKITTDYEKTANELATRFGDYETFYCRFNVEYGAEGISLEDWEKISEVTEYINTYLYKIVVLKVIDEIMNVLCGRKSTG